MVQQNGLRTPNSEPAYLAPTPSIKDANIFWPGSEKLGPDEMRISFLGSCPFPPRRSQAATCIMVELGGEDRLFFDFGNGCMRNVVAMQVPIGEVNDIFLTHLHLDHFGELPYLYTFAAHAGSRWLPLRITGPSGSTPEFGVASAVDGMRQMCAWAADSIESLPSGDGVAIEVTEFDWSEDGGVCYEHNGAVVTHWRRSHTKDGPSAYRLDWKGLSFVWTGDGRPDELTLKYGNEADVFVTEVLVENELTRSKWGLPEEMFKYIIDTHHTSHYAAGFMMDQIQPKLGVVTHFGYERDIAPSLVDGLRLHYGGPIALGLDLTVINATRESVWVREATVSDAAFTANPDFARLMQVEEAPETISLPAPRRMREVMQDQVTRDYEIDPAKYYPPGAMRELVTDWPEISFPSGSRG